MKLLMNQLEKMSEQELKQMLVTVGRKLSKLRQHDVKGADPELYLKIERLQKKYDMIRLLYKDKFGRTK